MLWWGASLHILSGKLPATKFPDQPNKFPDTSPVTSLLIPCCDLRLQSSFSCRMSNLEGKNAVLEVKIAQIPCYFPC
jgi:hypothetical protein